MKIPGRFGIAALVALSLGGCAAQSLSDSNSLDGVTTDATRRIVVTGTRKDGRMVTCAEPSPDALKALGASLAATLTDPKTQINAGVSAAFQQSLTQIGVRTATIQMLRDGLYRACEAYMNDALDEADYVLITTFFPQTAATLTAIEALGYGQFPANAAVGATATGTITDTKGTNTTTTSTTTPGATNTQLDTERAKASAGAILKIVELLYTDSNSPLFGACTSLLSKEEKLPRPMVKICTMLFETALKSRKTAAK